MVWAFPDIMLSFQLIHSPSAAELGHLETACRTFSAATAEAYPAPWFVASPAFDEPSRTLSVMLDTGPVTGNKADRDQIDALIRAICVQFGVQPSVVRLQ